MPTGLSGLWCDDCVTPMGLSGAWCDDCVTPSTLGLRARPGSTTPCPVSNICQGDPDLKYASVALSS
eukprot:520779-Pyramimonas_sp.AAC.1